MNKLSAFIREGATKRPQAFDDYVRLVPIDGDGWQYRTCALGAAYEAITDKLPEPDWLQDGKVVRAIHKATDIRDQRIPYPENTYPGREAYIVDMVPTLNDHFRWTREQIADYLESQGY
jgi:hypothetical protein